ncbi:unnamed protein product, partial [Symbiodinium sp. CCMP2456]
AANPATAAAEQSPSKPPLSLEARIAARQEDTETLEILTSVLRRSISGTDEQGRTLLFYAVRGNRDDSGAAQISKTAVAKAALAALAGSSVVDAAPHYLVQRRNFDVNFQVPSSGLTPLMEAARFGNAEAVEVLLSLRADPTLKDAAGLTALDIAKSRLPAYLEFK